MPEPDDDDCNVFECPKCHRIIYSVLHQDPPPTLCSVCEWLEFYIPDDEERESLRRRLDE
jgi:hypothetical protein